MQPISPPTAPGPARTSATLLYVYAFDPEEVPDFLTQCHQWADRHGWPVIGAFIDTGRMLPLCHRPQWSRVREHATAGSIRRVVTRYTSLASPIQGEAEVEQGLFARLGVDLEYAHGGVAPGDQP